MAFLVVLIAAAIVSCASVGYYGQAVRGHLDLTFKRRDIEKLINDPATAGELRSRLQRVKDIRRFAIRELQLPDSGSYTDYADLERDVTVWLVTAAPEFSVQPRKWCYPFVGCLTYRGYFDREKAADEARRLEEAGLETAISPGLAYSTLGFMDDPVLNTMLVYSDLQLAGLIFHELAHERVFIRGDTRFNESFASSVEQLGRRYYAAARDMPDEPARVALAREESFTAMMLDARQRLASLYAQEMDVARKRAGKRALLAQLADQYRSWKQQWDGYSGFDPWFEPDLPNNADFSLLATYESAVPAFNHLFVQCDRDFAAFYRAVDELAELDFDARWARLDELMDEVEAP